jgi:hypothetical protein
MYADESFVSFLPSPIERGVRAGEHEDPVLHYRGSKGWSTPRRDAAISPHLEEAEDHEGLLSHAIEGAW